MPKMLRCAFTAKAQPKEQKTLIVHRHMATLLNNHIQVLDDEIAAHIGDDVMIASMFDDEPDLVKSSMQVARRVLSLDLRKLQQFHASVGG